MKQAAGRVVIVGKKGGENGEEESGGRGRFVFVMGVGSGNAEKRRGAAAAGLAHGARDHSDRFRGKAGHLLISDGALGFP